MLGFRFGDQIWDDDDCRVVVNPKLEDGKERKPNSSPTPNRISQNRLEEGHVECMSWGFEDWTVSGRGERFGDGWWLGWLGERDFSCFFLNK
ncbi:unnamed protein product [Prunus armeniaca]|uniref:Uncharacterized protein n=1 Tax=Prunus armeniaca TaxID=36596 RepID=A0A6J5W5K3_PRUAR|nr:unnamed protein product [Prunus armeniaca]CAB4295145.1 unnamed protein product [Prunus armeniaca]